MISLDRSGWRWLLLPMSILGAGYFALNTISWPLPIGKSRTAEKFANLAGLISGLRTPSNHSRLRLSNPAGEWEFTLGKFNRDLLDDDGERNDFLCLPPDLQNPLKTIAEAQLDGVPAAAIIPQSRGIYWLRFPYRKILMVLKPDAEELAAAESRFRKYAGYGIVRFQNKDAIEFRSQEGFGLLEEPFSSADLPAVQWGYGPKSVITIRSLKAGLVRFRLILRNSWPEQTLTIICNGQTAGVYPLAGSMSFSTMMVVLPFQAGDNSIELGYSKWNRAPGGDHRPLAILFSDLCFFRSVVAETPGPTPLRDQDIFRYRETLVDIIQPSGLGNVEGPYPAQSLPQVRWGFGPKTTLDFTASAAGHIRMHLWYRNNFPGQSMGCWLNGILVAKTTLEVQEDFLPLTIDLSVRPGANRVELTWSQWSRSQQGDTRPLAVLFSRILIDQ